MLVALPGPRTPHGGDRRSPIPGGTLREGPLVATTTTRARPGVSLRRWSSGDAVRAGIITVLLLFVLIPLPGMLSSYWVDVLTSVTVYSIVALGLNLLMGRVGLVSLGQIAGLALGSWAAARITFASGLPFPLVLLGAGLVTMVLGTLVGLPALRLSGLYLALITLMLAGAITVALRTTNFPNGGKGFLGHTETSLGNPSVRRPAVAATDPAYLRYAIVVGVLLFLLALWHVRARPGRAW